MPIIDLIGSVFNKSGANSPIDLVQKVGGSLGGAATGLLGKLGDKFNVASRLGGQLTKGGFPLNGKTAAQTTGAKVAEGPVYLDKDWRVRLSFTDAIANELIRGAGLGLLDPLLNIGEGSSADAMGTAGVGTGNGIVFPYTPQINITYSAEYQAQKFTHSNYAAQFYTGSEIQDIQIQGEFSAQNEVEARYLLAVITFTKLVTKMFFANGAFVGNPPPILKLNGFGPYQFNNVPVIVKQANYTLPAEVDYIPTFNKGQLLARVPTQMSVSYTLAPVYSRNRVAQFNFTEFANGDLIKNRGFM